MNWWRPEWRDLVTSDDGKALEAELDDAESRILAELAADPTTELVARQVEAARPPDVAPAPVPSPAKASPAHGYRPAGIASRVSEVVDQSLTIPRGGASARVVGGQVLFGVSLPVEQAKAILDAWVELMESNDGDGGDDTPPSPEIVTISEFLFTLFDPVAETLSEQP